MAASREQAARIIHPELDSGDDLADVPVRQPAAREITAEGPAPVVSPNATSTAPQGGAKTGGRKRVILVGVGAILAIAAIAYGIDYMLVGRFIVSTDDAYVRANNTTLGARVAGHLTQIAVGDNAPIKAGDLIFRIDDGDYVNAVDAARNKVATQQSTIERIGRQVTAQQSTAEQTQAQLASAEAAVKRAQSEYDRQTTLSAKGFASQSTYEVALATRDQAVASLQAARAACDAARDTVEVIKAQQQEARDQLAELRTALAKAARDLAFTTIRAPVDGVFSNRLVNAGDYIQPGQRLGNVVPLDDVYVDANFKETQLARLRSGLPVSISVDARSDQPVKGTVESISPASGSVFTLLPPDNATGNFTKIVQRIPVRIRVPADVAKEHMMRAGMSVYVSIDTRKDANAKPN